MVAVRQKLTSATLQVLESACVAVANLPRGSRREWSRYRPWDLLKARIIAAHLHDGDRVLDVGCGTGHILAHLALFRAIKPQGVDIALHPKRFPDIPIAVFDGQNLELEDGAFDVTLLCYVMHHLTPAEASALFAEVTRVTRRRVFLIEDSMPSFGVLYRLRNRIHRFEAGTRYEASASGYRAPSDDSMFLTHDAWRQWLAAQPRVASVAVQSLANVSQHDHHTLLDVTLAPR